MSLIILKRESRANGELFCMKLPYKNSVPTRSLSCGWGRVASIGEAYFRIFVRPEGARE